VPEGLRQRLQTALRTAMKDRDTAAVQALRAALGAIDNAEAVPAQKADHGPTDSPIAGARHGLGAGEVPRQELTEDEVRTIVQVEIGDLRSNADEYEQLGQNEQAAGLRSQADVLEAHLSV
jgi:uncharacterized protein YqeY